MANYIDNRLGIRFSDKNTLSNGVKMILGESESNPLNKTNNNSFKYLTYENFGVTEIYERKIITKRYVIDTSFRVRAMNSEYKTLKRLFNDVFKMDKGATIRFCWFNTMQTVNYGEIIARRVGDEIIERSICIHDVKYKDWDDLYDDNWVQQSCISDVLLENNIPRDKIHYVDGSLKVHKTKVY
ncbi:MAG: hypothetical protein GJ671_00535 [Alteromonadaceae bacterium]|nr:hypothetical protein [Alteromonadaceae bacterium]